MNPTAGGSHAHKRRVSCASVRIPCNTVDRGLRETPICTRTHTGVCARTLAQTTVSRSSKRRVCIHVDGSACARVRGGERSIRVVRVCTGYPGTSAFPSTCDSSRISLEYKSVPDVARKNVEAHVPFRIKFYRWKQTTANLFFVTFFVTSFNSLDFKSLSPQFDCNLGVIEGKEIQSLYRETTSY